MIGRHLWLGAILAAACLATPAAGAPPAEEKEAKSQAEADRRTLLPLPFEVRDRILRNMRQENLGGLGKMLSALAEDDLEEVAQIAAGMSFTPDKQKASRRRGSRAFARMAARFHGERMPAVRRAAEMGDRRLVLKRLSEAVTSCNNCHTAFRLVEWPPDRHYDMPEPVAPPAGAGGRPEE
ncbi:MAG: hypothetical protein ACOCUM_00750 [Thiohalospira sp.]